MIKAKDLRIGNLFGTDFDKSVYELDHITHGTTMLFWIKGGNEFIKDIDAVGIPLTEEWLLKFGFTGDYGEFTKGDFYFDCEYTGKDEWVVKWRNTYIDQEVWHVHQLQNLYFALTGRELELK